jgi:hypothetical protein
VNRWFRFYDEALDDPKVQNLDGDTFKHWVNILCIAARHGGKLPCIADIAFALRIPDNAAITVVERLLNATLIDRCNGGADGWHYAPHGWGKRQYKSDSSTERVKRFRNVTKPLHETAPDTDSEQTIPLAKANGGSVDREKLFWELAKAHIGGSNPGALIGKWKRDYGLPETKAAISASQIEGAVDPVSFITAVLRRNDSGGKVVQIGI